MPTTTARRARFWSAFLVLVIAAAVRLPTLTWRSLDFDEGASLHYSSLPYRDLAVHFSDLSIDRHPLLFYLLLKGWRQVADEADFALRLPAAASGMLTVALVYQIGRRRLGEATARLAALLTALNPLLIAQNQDVRMYAPAVLFATLAVWALLDVLDRPTPRLGPRLAVFALALTAAGYTHLIAATLYPAVGLMLAWELCRQRRGPSRRGPSRRAIVGGIAALGLSALAYAPYLFNILRQGRAGSGGAELSDWARMGLGAIRTLLDFQSAFNVPGNMTMLVGLLIAILVAGTVRGGRVGVPFALWFVTVLGLTLFVAVRIDFFQTKVFALSVAPLSLVAALACRGRARAVKWRDALPALALVGLTSYGLLFQWRPGQQREDFRTAAQFVEARVTPQDTVIVHLSWASYVFGHYATYPFAHPFPNNVDAATPIADLVDPYLDSEVVWLVQAGVGLKDPGGDPDRVVQRWFNERYPLITAVYPSGVDVRGYATRYRYPALPASATPLGASYSNGLIVAGHRLPEPELPTRDVWLHPPSTWAPVTLFLSVAEPLTSDVRISLLLEDETGGVWGGQIDRNADVRAFYPPVEWIPGEIVRWDFDLNTNPEIPPGEYKVVLRVVETDSDAALTLSDGRDWLILDRVRFIQ